MVASKKPLEAGTNQLELLEFSINEIQESGIYHGLYGINVYKVRHVVPMPTVTPVPLQAPCVEGVFHFRGENIPLVNLAKYLGIRESPHAQDKMVIIAEFSNMQFGFIVHGAHNIRRVSWKDLRTPPENQRDTIYRGITGIALIQNALVRLLDLEEIVVAIGLGESQYNDDNLAAAIREAQEPHSPPSVAEAALPELADAAVARPAVPLSPPTVDTYPEPSSAPEPARAAAPAPDPAGAAPAPEMETNSHTTPTGKLVMVVDDSILSREAMTKVLQAAGYSVISVKDGEEAWDRITIFLNEARRQNRSIEELLALAFIDIEMPQMDGFSLTRRIKESPELKGVKVVLHTSLGGPENIYKGYRMGADEFLVKFNPKLLLEMARRFTR